MRRTLLLLLCAAAVVAAGFSIPTTAEGPVRVAPIADYLHQVIGAAPMPSGALGTLVRQVDEATGAPSCASLAPALDRLRPAAERAIDDPETPGEVSKVLAQLVSYGHEVDDLCPS